MAKKKAMGLEPLPPIHQISDDFSSEDEESHLFWKDEVRKCGHASEVSGALIRLKRHIVQGYS
jgi:hypothetical protein